MASAKDFGLTPGRGFNPPDHNGKDWAAPMSTDVFPNDNRMKTGNTGLSTGPHLHTQAGADFYAQKPIDPTRHEFQPGEVVQVGWGSEWGNYVIVKNFTSGIYVVYAHLSEIDVMPGDVVGGTVIDEYNLNVLYRFFLGRAPYGSEVNAHVGKTDPNKLARTLQKSATFKTRMTQVKNPAKYNITNHLPSELRANSALYTEYLKLLNTNPPVTVLEPGRYDVK